MFTFVKLAEEHLPLVLAWRTKPRVADRMFTKVGNDFAKHREWFAKLKDPYWVIHLEGRPIGVINQTGDTWGYYIGHDDATPLGGLVPPYFYNHVFKTRDYLRAEVMVGNRGVMQLHLFHGYKLVGQDERLTTVLELSRSDWQAQAQRYGHMQAEFPA